MYAAVAGLALTSCGGGSNAKLKDMQAKLDSLESINGDNTDSINSHMA